VQAPDAFPVDQLVSVPEGESVQAIGKDLESQGVIRSPLMFRALMVVFGRERGARAGDYLFKQPLSVWSVARAIASGSFGLEPIRIRIPEGATTKQMASIYSKELQRFDSDRFLAEAKPLEGYLFPDTYFFLPNSTESNVIQAMHQNFEDHIATIQNEFASSTHPESDIIIMASILEKEAFNTEDRRMISGVLWNRLSKGMALQVDATFLYTLGKGSFDLTMKDLTTDSPYNTYTNKGLPPTPIGSPSMDSIEAALHPIQSDYLFYLADRTGVTHYAKTYAEHLLNRKLYLSE
jgi:peptidoglycan lytic transglycosylase G